jgi:hypothetical protein
MLYLWDLVGFLGSIPIRNPTESNRFSVFRLRVAAYAYRNLESECGLERVRQQIGLSVVRS